MTSRERLLATVAGKPVDRPAVNFYEIGGFMVDPNDPDPYNVYNDPSWKPLLELAENETDITRFVGATAKPMLENCRHEYYTDETIDRNGARFIHTTLRVDGRTLTSVGRRDPELHTVWMIEHLLKDIDDLKAFLKLPDEVFAYEPDVSNMPAVEDALGDRGVVIVDTADPLCHAAGLFSMETYTTIAYTEPVLFRRLLDKFARWLYPYVETVAKAFPGRLWRVVGPEYATEPYLPQELFQEYVVNYTKPIVQSIQSHGGYARLHCHGRIRSALPHIVSMEVTGLDPLEPPPQGDVELAEVRREYGRDLVLFGNIEVSDIENLAPREFERVAARALEDGTRGEGRGFVLMPTSCPYGRTITSNTLENYRTLIRLAQQG